MGRNKKGSGAGANLWRRIIIYGILILILGCLQCAFFPFLKVCPATPDLIMGALLGIALLDSPTSAAVTSVCAGFFIDAIGGAGIALSPLIYLFYVLVISAFSGKVLKSFFSYILLLLPSLIYRAAVTYVSISAKTGALALLPELRQIILPEAISTALFCLPVYFLVKLCVKPIGSHGRFTF